MLRRSALPYRLDRRPGTIVRRIKIDLPRPRDLKLRLGSEFQAIVAEIKELFMSYGVI